MPAIILDTQVWLWALSTPENLSQPARDLIESPQTELFLSSASAWEICIKTVLGKLILPEPPNLFIPSRMKQLACNDLAIRLPHTLAIPSLPKIHRDPFDRMILAQSLVENIPLLTADPIFKQYPGQILWA